MTLEQLLSPAVMEWCNSFEQRMNETNSNLTPEQMEEAFDKWLIENEDLVNKSVDDNLNEINESIDSAVELSKSINEGIFDDETFDDDILSANSEDVPITGEVETDIEEEEPQKTTLISSLKLKNSKDEPKQDVFVCVNALYDRLKKMHTNKNANSIQFRKLDVSNVRDMTALFAFTDLPDGDLSSWDTSNVVHMEGMFYKSTFNNDSICGWNVSSCRDFKNMFSFSKFNQSLNKWTPGFITVVDRDEDGNAIKDGNGTLVKKSIRASLPLIGANANEEAEALVRYFNGIFNDIEKQVVDEDVKKYVLDFDTFVNEGKVKDFINKGFEKIKHILKSIAIKFGDIVAFFKETGEMYPAVSAYTSLNTIANGNIPGVTAFCRIKNEYINDNVPSKVNIVESPEYYGIIDKDSIEYKNYLTFKNMINEHYEKYGNTGALMLNEGTINADTRVGFRGEDGGIVDVPDITSKDLGEIILDAIKNVPAYKGENAGGSILIWGAPGIGKSTIPKAVVKEWNDNPDNDAYHKKAVMVVECGDLTVDGFTLPIPVNKTVSEYIDERHLLNDIVKKSGIPQSVVDNIKIKSHKVSTEAPKTWLPCFKISSNQEEMEILNDIANGHVQREYVKNRFKVTETTEGGILLMDEFFRANTEIFKILMQLLLTRTYNDEFLLGDKWAIIACSNRPNDDAEVEKKFSSTGAVVGTRFLGGQYNFIPDFDEWKKWAITKGKFDDATLEFLIQSKDSKTGEYTNWHTIKPLQYEQGKVGWPTPRTWSALMNELNLYKDNHNYSSVSKIPGEVIEQKASAIIGASMAKSYVIYLKNRVGLLDVKELLNNPEYKIPDEKCSEVCKKIERYIEVVYSPDNIPTVDQLLNLFNNLNETYPPTKDNFVKILHVNLIKFLGVLKNKNTKVALKDYLQTVDKRFNLQPDDLR